MTHIFIGVSDRCKWFHYLANRHLLCANHMQALGIDTEIHVIAKQGAKGPTLFTMPFIWHAEYLANSIPYVLWDNSFYMIDVENKAWFYTERGWGLIAREEGKLRFESGLSHSRAHLSFHISKDETRQCKWLSLFPGITLKKSINVITFENFVLGTLQPYYLLLSSISGWVELGRLFEAASHPFLTCSPPTDTFLLVEPLPPSI